MTPPYCDCYYLYVLLIFFFGLFYCVYQKFWENTRNFKKNTSKFPVNFFLKFCFILLEFSINMTIFKIFSKLKHFLKFSINYIKISFRKFKNELLKIWTIIRSFEWTINNFIRIFDSNFLWTVWKFEKICVGVRFNCSAGKLIPLEKNPQQNFSLDFVWILVTGVDKCEPSIWNRSTHYYFCTNESDKALDWFNYLIWVV